MIYLKVIETVTVSGVIEQESIIVPAFTTSVKKATKMLDEYNATHTQSVATGILAF